MEHECEMKWKWNMKVKGNESEVIWNEMKCICRLGTVNECNFMSLLITERKWKI